MVGLALAKGLFLSLLEPPFHGPDEPYHFDHAQAIAEGGRLPPPALDCRGPMFSEEVRAAVQSTVQGVAFHPEARLPPRDGLHWPTGPAARTTTGCGPAAIYPPLWYAAAAAAYRFAGDRPLQQRLLATRWVSVAWSGVAALAALALGILLVGPLRRALLFAVLVVLQPMAGVMNALANSESAALACAAVAFAALAAIHRRVAPRAARAVLSCALALGVLSKPGFALACPLLAALAFLALRRRRHPLLETTALFAPAALALAAFELLGPARLGLHHEIEASGSLRDQLLHRVLAPKRLFDVWVEQVWMKHGWMDINVPRPLYLLLALATVLAAAGLYRVRLHRRRERAIALSVGGGSMLMVLALYGVAWQRGDLLWVQGRYVLVLFPAYAYLLYRGLSALSGGPRLAWAFGMLLALVNVAGAATAMRRFYGHGASSTLAGWQAGWGVPLLAPSGAVALALALLLLGLGAWPRRRPAVRAP